MRAVNRGLSEVEFPLIWQPGNIAVMKCSAIKFLSVLIGAVFCSYGLALGQHETKTDLPVIGKPIPPFEITGIKFHSTNSIGSGDQEGKWLILDFFSKGCSSCFEALPKTNKLYKEFRNRLTILLVGSTHDGDDIVNIYEKFRKRQGLELPVAFQRELFDRWSITAVPHLIWIDNKGIVKAISPSQDLSESNIKKFLSGQPFYSSDISFDGVSNRNNSYNYNEPLLINGNGGNSTDFLFRSLLARWPPTGLQIIPANIESIKETGIEGLVKFQATGAILEWLYEFAYFGEELNIRSKYGEYYHKPVFYLSDSSLFSYDFQTGKNIYNYSLIVPSEKGSRSSLMSFMQRDLKNYFGYAVSIENVSVPYWSITADKHFIRKLKSRESIQTINGSHAGYTFKNVSIQQIIQVIAGYDQHQPPFIDETGLQFNVSVEIDALMTDLNAVMGSLKKQGLNFEMKKRIMPAMVVRDQQKE